MEKIKQKKFVRAKDIISRLSIGKSTLYRYLNLMRKFLSVTLYGLKAI
mgnify:CR=1 FL=1